MLDKHIIAENLPSSVMLEERSSSGQYSRTTYMQSGEPTTIPPITSIVQLVVDPIELNWETPFDEVKGESIQKERRIGLAQVSILLSKLLLDFTTFRVGSIDFQPGGSTLE